MDKGSTMRIRDNSLRLASRKAIGLVYMLKESEAEYIYQMFLDRRSMLGDGRSLTDLMAKVIDEVLEPHHLGLEGVEDLDLSVVMREGRRLGLRRVYASEEYQSLRSSNNQRLAGY